MKIGIAGLGTIGLKLVEYLSEKGFDVVAYNWRSLTEKKKRFLTTLEKKMHSNKIDFNNMELIKKRVIFTESIEDLKGCYIVIESLMEDYKVKTDFYKEFVRVVGSNYVLGTTTSCLSLEKLSVSLNITNFFGLHFFNPPTKMKLVEVSFLDHNIKLREKVFRFLDMLDDKKVVEIPPIQGYIVNSILFANINFAITFHLNTNIAIKDIDEAMKLGTNTPMGPFELSDYIGNDVSLQILQELYNSLRKEEYKPTKLLIDMVADKKLGRKTGEGFYSYLNVNNG